MGVGRDITALVAQLTLDEKAALTAGEDLWSTVAIERLGIPKVQLTDGPNGARGAAVPGAGALSSACIPCGSAIGAMWDEQLVERLGVLVGEEARTKACRVLLAPTVNIHRSPLGGRNFECYAEDPFLSGKTAAAFIRGVQSQDVATTVKHFVANDAEFERFTIDSVVDERTLREVYLLPFELAVREGGSLGVMTAYNRINGVYAGEQTELLAVLRDEWGFEGFVVSDWFAAFSTSGAATAGLDLEMPGPARRFGHHVAAAVTSGDLDETVVDAQVRHLLTVFDRIGALDHDPLQSPASVDRPDHRALAREAAAASMVLLRNEGVLPFDPGTVRSLAVIGPNADRAQIAGGGSASVSAHYRVTPLAGIRAAFPDADIRFERGCVTDKLAPVLTPDAGLALEVYGDLAFGGPVLHHEERPTGELLFFGPVAPGVPAEGWSLRASGTYTPAETGAFTLAVTQAGRVRVLLDGEVVVDGTVDPPPPGASMFGLGSAEMFAEVELTAGRAHAVVIELSSREASVLVGTRVGLAPPAPDDMLDRAVAVATSADAVIVVVGTNDDWESEGHDRTSMDLPGEQDELVRRVVAANPQTAVVVNAGSPVTMDWAEDVPAILQIWFPGQELGNALADVLTGAADPGGRLPTTIPLRLEHNPSFGNFPGERHRVRYGEGVLVGYRWYEARHLPVRFPFGHGLSYTTFSLGTPELSATTIGVDDEVVVKVRVTNTGDRAGSEVVQCYVAPIAPDLTRPPKELKAYAKVHLVAGGSATVSFRLGGRAFAHWDPGDGAAPDPVLYARPMIASAPGEAREKGWRVAPGRYDLHIGRSSADIAHVVPVTLSD